MSVTVVVDCTKITIFELQGTDIKCECRPLQKDIIIWKGEEVLEIITGPNANDRNEKAHEWLKKHVPEYDETKMVRIK